MGELGFLNITTGRETDQIGEEIPTSKGQQERNISCIVFLWKVFMGDDKDVEYNVMGDLKITESQGFLCQTELQSKTGGN